MRRYWRIAAWEMLKRRRRSFFEATRNALAIHPPKCWSTGVPVMTEATVIAVGEDDALVIAEDMTLHRIPAKKP